MKISSKFVALLLFALLATHHIRANSWSVQVIGDRKIRINFLFDTYKILDDSLAESLLQRIQTPEQTYTMQKFAPELPVFAQAFWSRDTARWTVRVVDSSFVELNNVFIAPYISKKDSSLAQAFGSVYHTDEFWPHKTCIQASTREYAPEIFGSNVRCFPVQFNPKRKTIRIFKSLSIECEGPATEQLPTDKLNNEFSQIYTQHFANALIGSRLKRLSTIAQRGKMLIVAPNEFNTALKPFIQWKRQNGIECQTIDSRLYVTAERLKEKIKQTCSTENFAYLLLVGDAELVPTVPVMFDQAAVSDAEYAYLNDRDFYPDLMVGRWSGKNIADIESLVTRTLHYEQTTKVNDPWPSRYLLTASADNKRGDNGEYDFEHLQLIADTLQVMNYKNGSFLHDDTSGAKLSLANFVQGFNKGNGLFFYTGHGLINQFQTSGFSNASCSELRNIGQLPFAVIAGCQVGRFVDTTCLAEALMLSSYQNQPTGTIAIMASSIDQKWNPPMYMQDKFIDLMKKFKSRNGLHTFGSLALAACYATNDLYNNFAWSTTDTWILFGDPSLQIRTEAAHSITANYEKSIPINTKTIRFSCNDSLAYATIMQENTVWGFSACESNTIEFNNLSFKSLKPLIITINAPNAAPIIDTIKITNSSTDYIAVNERYVRLKSNLINGTASYSDTLSLELKLQNYGQLASSSQRLYLESNQIINQTASISVPSIAANSSINLADRLLFSFNQSIKNGERVLLQLRTDQQIIDTFSIIVRSPELKINSITILPTNLSNGDHIPNPGELDSISIQISNTSIFPLTNIKTTISNVDKCTFIETFQTIKLLEAGKSTIIGSKLIFDTIHTTSAKPHFTIASTSGNNSDSINQSYELQYATETWEDSSFANLPWQNTSSLPWEINKESHFGRFSLRSGSIGDDDSTQLLLHFDLERNDTISFWYRTSCEDQYGTTIPDIEYFDYLQFTLDNRKYRWAGENEWNRFSLLLAPGNYTARWTYFKDASKSYYSDAAWIDNIKIPASIKTVVNLTNASDTTIFFTDSLYWQPRFSNLADDFGYYHYPSWLNRSTTNSLIGLPESIEKIDTLITWTKFNGTFRVQLFTITKKVRPDTTDLQIIMYPQPSSHFSLIKSNYSIDNITITSVWGQTIKEYRSVLSTSVRLMLDELPDGFYIIKISTVNGERLLPLIKHDF